MTELVNRQREREPFTSGPGYWMRIGYKCLTRQFSQKLKNHGISFTHYFYLRALFEEDGVTQAELSDRIGIERPTVTAVLDTMEGVGLVQRRPHPSDRRKTNVFLTPKGERFRQPMLDAIADSNRITLRGISRAEFERFRKTLATMMANVEEHLAETAETRIA
jgi:MarR family transcriptional regulator, organic hydroperoxide resistance regulator